MTRQLVSVLLYGAGTLGLGELARYLGLVVQAWVWQLVTSPFRQRCLNGILNLAVVRKERHVDVPIALPSWDIGWDKEVRKSLKSRRSSVGRAADS